MKHSLLKQAKTAWKYMDLADRAEFLRWIEQSEPGREIIPESQYAIIRELNYEAARGIAKKSLTAAGVLWSAYDEVYALIKAFRVLVEVNNGKDTAKQFGKCADEMSAAMSGLQRELMIASKDPLLDIKSDSVQALVSQCAAIIIQANTFSTISDDKRPTLQAQLRLNLAAAEGRLDELLKNDDDRYARIQMAEMLKARLTDEMPLKKAMEGIRRLNPAMYQKVFGGVKDVVSQADINHAYQLIRRISP